MKVINRTDKLGYALAPRRLVEERLRVRFMYREAPDNPSDSGWRFFSGDETDAYVNDPANIAIYDVSTITALDPDVIPHLGAPAGSAFEREDPAAPFVPSPAFG